MKDLDVLTKKERDRLFNLDQALSKLDQLYFSIQSKIKDLIDNLRVANGKESTELLRDLGLRLEGLYQRLIDGEMALLELAATYYQIYLGPFREPGKKMAFDRTKSGRRAIARATSLFHSFTVEYGSILDLGLKIMLSLTDQELPPQITNLDSYGKFVSLTRKEQQLRIDLEKHPVTRQWLKYENLMTSMKNRRDQFIHHPQVSAQVVSGRTSLGYVELSYWSPEVHRRDRESFDVRKDVSLRYNYYCRAALYALLKVIDNNLFAILDHTAT